MKVDWKVEPGDYIGFTWLDAGVIPFHYTPSDKLVSNYWTVNTVPVVNNEYVLSPGHSNRVYSFRAAYTVHYALCKLE